MSAQDDDAYETLAHRAGMDAYMKAFSEQLGERPLSRFFETGHKHRTLLRVGDEICVVEITVLFSQSVTVDEARKIANAQNSSTPNRA